MNDASSAERDRLRREMRARRAALNPIERVAAAQQLAQTIRSSEEFSNSRHVAGYWAMPEEQSLQELFAGEADADRQFYLPVTQNQTLLFAPYRWGDTLLKGRFNIHVPAHEQRVLPEALDLVLVPLLAFDAGCNRLGMGGGFYDRSFSFVPDKQKPLLMGIGFEFQKLPQLPIANWDVPLHAVCTEQQIHRP